MSQIYLAAAIVVHQDQVLIVRRSFLETFKPGVWGVPCGKVDAEEKPGQAVLRELYEETGLNGRVITYTGVSKFPSYWRGEPTTNIQRNYLVYPLIDHCTTNEASMPQVKTPELDQAYRWVPVGEVERQELDDHNLGTLQQGLKAQLTLQQQPGAYHHPLGQHPHNSPL